MMAVVLADDSPQTRQLAGAAQASLGNSFRLADPDLVSDVLRVWPEKNILNLPIETARNIGTGIGCDHLLVLSSEVLRRSSSEKEAYYEAYALAFFVDAHSGKLLYWKYLSAEADSAESAGKALLAAFIAFLPKAPEALASAALEDKKNTFDTSVYEIKGDGDRMLRTPLPFRRYSPSPTALAQHLRVEVTVDIEVAVDTNGFITQTRIVRWAGLGLDEAVSENVRKMNFRAAVLDGKAIPARFLLRYTFQIPREKKDRP